MNTLNKWLVVAVAALLSACVVESDETSSAESRAGQELPPGKSWRESYLLLGKETYERACASCHDEGLDGAPAIGDRGTWSERSPLWSAVLLEHAKNGYLEMPARGGYPELTDRSVEAAGEYMLSKTFPELPLD